MVVRFQSYGPFRLEPLSPGMLMLVECGAAGPASRRRMLLLRTRCERRVDSAMPAVPPPTMIYVVVCQCWIFAQGGGFNWPCPYIIISLGQG